MKKVNVRVVLHDDKPIDFDLETMPLLPKGPKKNEFIFQNKDHPGFEMNFILQGDALGYRFPDDPEDALYSAVGTDCPRTKGQWPQFVAIEVKGKNRVLVVWNFNETQTTFAYTLRLTKTPHQPDPVCIDLDPVGQNRNGRMTSSVSSVTAVVIAGLTAALTATAVLFAFGALQF